MSFRNWLEMKSHLSSRRMQSIQTEEEAEKFPCECCEGQGMIVVISKFKRVKGGDILGKSGGPISCSEIIICPECTGSGINVNKILNG